MAKFQISFPTSVRDLHSELSQLLRGVGLDMMPISINVPNISQDNDDKGVMKFWYGGKTVAHVSFESWISHGMRTVNIVGLRMKVGFLNRKSAETWIEDLEKFSGPLGWQWEELDLFNIEGRLQFSVEGLALDRLSMNASNRRNSLPEYHFDAPNHPFLETRRQ